MTDLEKFSDMVTKAGLPFELDVDERRNRVSLAFEAGYSGFVSYAVFELSTGALKAIEAYE